VTGEVDDGTPTSPIGSAECRFVLLDGTVRTADTIANVNGVYVLVVFAGEEGFVDCNPGSPRLPRLKLLRYVSTEGNTPAQTFTAEDLTPQISAIAKIIKDTNPTNKAGVWAQLLADLAVEDSALTLLVEAITALFNAMLDAGIDDVSFEDAIEDIITNGEVTLPELASIKSTVDAAIAAAEAKAGITIEAADADVKGKVPEKNNLAGQAARIQLIQYKEQISGGKTHVLAKGTGGPDSPLTDQSPTVEDLTGLIEVTFTGAIPGADNDKDGVPDFLESQNVILKITEVESGITLIRGNPFEAGDFFDSSVSGAVLRLRIKPQSETARDLAPGLTYTVTLDVGEGVLDAKGQPLSSTLNDVTVSFKTADEATCSEGDCQQKPGAKITKIEYTELTDGGTTVTLAIRNQAGVLVPNPDQSVKDLTGRVDVTFDKAVSTDILKSENVILKITELSSGITLVRGAPFEADDFFDSSVVGDGKVLRLRIKPQPQTSRDLAPGDEYTVVLDVGAGVRDAAGNLLSSTANDVTVKFTTDDAASCSQPGCQQAP